MIPEPKGWERCRVATIPDDSASYHLQCGKECIEPDPTVMLMVVPAFVDGLLWPKFTQLAEALREYVHGAPFWVEDDRPLRAKARLH